MNSANVIDYSTVCIFGFCLVKVSLQAKALQKDFDDDGLSSSRCLILFYIFN